MGAIHCDNDKFCNNGYIENSRFAFTQLGDNYWLILQSIGIIISIAFFNAFGVGVTKHASAPQRSTIDTSRTVLIWVVFLAV